MLTERFAYQQQLTWRLRLTTTDSMIKIDHIVLKSVLCIQDYWQWWLMVVSVSAGCCFIEDLTVKKGECLTAFDCLLMWIAEKLPDLRLNNWVSGYRNAKLLLLVKLSPSYTSTAWISPQGMWEMYLTFEEQAVWNNFTLCRGGAMSLSRVGQKWLGLNILLACLPGWHQSVWKYSAERHFPSVK